MASRPFVHLHCHSHYSLLDGASKIPALVRRAKALGMHGRWRSPTTATSTAPSSSSARPRPPASSRSSAWRPTSPPARAPTARPGGASGQEHAFHLTLLARTGEGFRNLMRLSSKAFLEGFYYKPRIDKEILERHAEGLICLSGCASAEFSDLLLHDKTRRGRGALRLVPAGLRRRELLRRDPEQRRPDPARLRGAGRRHRPPDGPAGGRHQRRPLPDPARTPAPTTSCSASTPARRSTTRTGCSSTPTSSTSAAPTRCTPRCPATTRPWPCRPAIAELVEENYASLDLGKRQLPLVPAARGARRPRTTSASSARRACASATATAPARGARERLDHELGIIDRMGFASYFLIVWDFVRFAREQGIPSSARGSACGALVSYLLYLSHVDPLKYDLLFERFLDPNRSEAPDIDIDLCKDRRYEVIEYVRKKYGAANVAQIGTFGTMAAKAALKDVGRALNIPLSRVDQVTKLDPDQAEHHARGGAQGGARSCGGWSTRTPRSAG